MTRGTVPPSVRRLRRDRRGLRGFALDFAAAAASGYDQDSFGLDSALVFAAGFPFSLLPVLSTIYFLALTPPLAWSWIGWTLARRREGIFQPMRVARRTPARRSQAFLLRPTPEGVAVQDNEIEGAAFAPVRSRAPHSGCSRASFGGVRV